MSKQAMFDAFKAGWEAREKRFIQNDEDLSRVFQAWYDNVCQTGQRGAFDIIGAEVNNKTIAERYSILRQFHTGEIDRLRAIDRLITTGVDREDAIHLTQKD